MVRGSLQNRVEDHFGMSLARFIGYHTQVESLCDYEIAELLTVNTALIGRLRKRFGIKRADGFLRRFKGTYGEDALERFREIIQQPHASLSDVGRHFGFSRQYASELYKKIYGRSYREIRQREREATNRNLKEMSKKPKQLKQVLMMKGKMESLGLAVRVHKKEHGYFLATNGHKVAVRFSATYRLRGRREYFQVTNLKGAARFDYDFLIVGCIRGADQAYYVIPRHAVPENGLSLMPQANAKSKYSRFRDAWHLLTPKGMQTLPAKCAKGVERWPTIES